MNMQAFTAEQLAPVAFKVGRPIPPEIEEEIGRMMAKVPVKEFRFKESGVPNDGKLSERSLLVLRLAAENGGVRRDNDLAARIGVSRQCMSSETSSLVTRGLLDVQQPGTRKARLTITEAGREELQGPEKPKPGKRATRQERKTLYKAASKAGMTVDQAARFMGVTKSAVRQYAKLHRLTFYLSDDA